MRVFVAGASGVLGRRVVALLVHAGHEVTGTTRRRERLSEIEDAGATAERCDVYDRDRLFRAIRESSAEVVIHLLTELPARYKPRGATTSTDRLRREGTHNLLAAARAADARRCIAESVAFAYRPDGDRPRSETDPLWLDAPGSLSDTIRAVNDLERQVLGTSGVSGTVLRFGWLYGPGTWFEPGGSIGRDVRRRLFPLVGEGRGVWSFVHVDDAARAVLAALDRSDSGIYNIVDDDPAPMREWLPTFAEAIRARRPLRAPKWLGTLTAGRAAVEVADRLAGATNARAKAELGWAPRHASWRTGFATIDAHAGPVEVDDQLRGFDHAT